MSKNISTSHLTISNSRPRSISYANFRHGKPQAKSNFQVKPALNARSKSVVFRRPTTSETNATTLQKPLNMARRRQGSLPTDGIHSMENLGVSKNDKAAGDKVKSKFPLHRPLVNLITQQRLNRWSRIPKIGTQRVVGFGTSIKKTQAFGSQTDSSNSKARLNVHLSNQTDLLAEKNAALEDLKQSQIQLLNELNEQKLINADLMKRLAAANEKLKSSATTAQKDSERIEYLEAELNKARELVLCLQGRSDELVQVIREKERAISDLKAQLKNVKKHRDLLVNKVNKLLRTKTAHNELQTSYEEAVSRIGVLQTQIAEKEELIAEYAKLEENLQSQLKDSREDYRTMKERMICLQEEAQRDQQLIHARSEMINSLMLHDADAQRTMDEMFYKVKDELDSKKAEFRNLLNTLTTNQMELHRKDHIIKLLEESNGQNAELNAVQEKKNSEMLTEIAHLKRTIRSYAKIIVGSSGQQLFEYVPNTEPEPAAEQ